MKKITNTKTLTTKAPKATTLSAGCREHPVPYPGCPDCEAEATRQEQMKADQTKLKAGDQKRKASVKAAKAAKAPKAVEVAKEQKAAGTSKKDQILALISGKNGATLDEIMTATGWQKHTVRGFIAILGKKGTKIESFKSEAGARTYKAA